MSLSFPNTVQIQTSNKCNADCVFCPYSHTEAKKDFQIMDWKLYKKIIDECSENKVQNILPFLFNEPLLNKELVKYINYAKEKNPASVIKIFTNGSLLTNKLSKELLDSKIDQVIFSFNGSTKEEYESSMKNLDFEKTKKRISEFIKLRGEKNKPKIAIHMLKVGFSESSFSNIRNYWNSLGVAVHIFKYENRAGNVADYDITSPSNIKKVPCKRLLTQIYILVNGDVILCCADWKSEVVLGNLKKQTISEVWNGEKRLEYEKAHLEGRYDELKLCDVCNFNEVVTD
ncbi:MAG: SPASM domain-containing protein [Nanoarchaeota archaeon]|nr:SPASM domain-containing protein [Nanoarchaeota archaeon]